MNGPFRAVVVAKGDAILRCMSRRASASARFLSDTALAETSWSRVPSWLTAAIPPLTIVLLSSTVFSWIMGDRHDLADGASLILCGFATWTWGAHRLWEPPGMKAATLRLFATVALLAGAAMWTVSLVA